VTAPLLPSAGDLDIGVSRTQFSCLATHYPVSLQMYRLSDTYTELADTTHGLQEAFTPLWSSSWCQVRCPIASSATPDTSMKQTNQSQWKLESYSVHW